MQALRLGTRGSILALTQARYVAKSLESEYNIQIKLEKITTTGDRTKGILESVGAFVKEIDRAVLDRRVDFAVHSMKDVPLEQPQGISIPVVPPRASPYDVILTHHKIQTIDEFSRKARIGTSSPRRKSELLRLRKDLDIIPMRGNLDTRIKKLRDQRLDGIVVAKAGIDRCYPEGISDVNIILLSEKEMLPCPGQGALCVVTREDNQEIHKYLEKINHLPSYFETIGERSCLEAFGGGCFMPFGTLARVNESHIKIDAAYTKHDGSVSFRQSKEGSVTEASDIGGSLGAILLELKDKNI